jgi:hypothetical protein
MYPSTPSRQLRRARATSSTDSSWPSRVPTATQPSADGVLSVDQVPLVGYGLVELIFKLTDASSANALVRAG